MTLTQAIEQRRMDLIIEFVLYLREGCEFLVIDIQRVFEEPWKWEPEFSEWMTTLNEYDRSGTR